MGVSAGWGSGVTFAAAGPAAGSGSDVELAEGAGWGRGSVCSAVPGHAGSVRGSKDSCSVEGPESCGSVEDVQGS